MQELQRVACNNLIAHETTALEINREICQHKLLTIAAVVR